MVEDTGVAEFISQKGFGNDWSESFYSQQLISSFTVSGIYISRNKRRQLTWTTNATGSLQPCLYEIGLILSKMFHYYAFTDLSN